MSGEQSIGTFEDHLPGIFGTSFQELRGVIRDEMEIHPISSQGRVKAVDKPACCIRIEVNG